MFNRDTDLLLMEKLRLLERLRTERDRDLGNGDRGDLDLIRVLLRDLLRGGLDLGRGEGEREYERERGVRERVLRRGGGRPPLFLPRSFSLIIRSNIVNGSSTTLLDGKMKKKIMKIEIIQLSS
ncbi:Hypothetical protein NTJ_15081 [Nesidiocoris tenuis]|uniref:Uncharacterized protein n=1 Tax=Nesidiocoris tenuis TaxID=355587 RepID=A0ABN7BH40_9HEMI|nr:Hypothetical protein NTJ_15081 [Nesidiocoris tenuis]